MAWGDPIPPSDTEPVDSPMELEGVTVQEFDTMRAFLLTNLTAGDLPDETIGNEGYFISARRDVHAVIGTENLDAIINSANPAYSRENFDVYRLCVMLLTAVYMCHSTPDLEAEAIGPIRRSWEDTDWTAKERNLRNRYQDNIVKILPTSNYSGGGFVRVTGRRGRF